MSGCVQLQTRFSGLGESAQERVLRLAASGDAATRRALQAQSQTSDAESRARAMEKSVKNSAIKTACLQAGVQLGLMAIPVVGQAVSAIAGYALGSAAKKYGERLQSYGKKITAEIEAYVLKRQGEYDSALNYAYQTAYRKAAPLALSWQPLEFSKGAKYDIINQEVYGVIEGLDGPFDKFTGKDMYEKGKRHLNEMRDKAKKDIDNQVLPIIRKVKQGPFIDLLAKTIAVDMRKNPEFMNLAKQIGVPPPSKYIGQGEPGVPNAGHQGIPHKQNYSIGATGSTSLQSQGADRLSSTGDQNIFMRAIEKGQDVVEKGNMAKIGIGVIGLGVAAFMLTR